MRYLGAEEFLQIAAILLGVEARDVRLYVRLERMQRVLSPPTVYTAGVGATTVVTEAARLFTEIIRVRPLPSGQNVKCAWISMLRFLEINNRRWIARVGDDEERKQLITDIRCGDAVGTKLTEWISRHLAETQRDAWADQTDPRVHVTSAITNLPVDKRDEVDELANAIDDAISEFVAAKHLPYQIGTYRPSLLSTTNGGDADAALAATDRRLLAADGVVVIGACGGSIGAGIDVAVALAALLPVLYLQPEDEELSLRTQALLDGHGASIRRYRPGPDAEAAVVSHVKRWLEREGRAIADTRRTRMITRIRLAACWRALRRAEAQLSRVEFRSRLAAQRMDERFGRLLLADIDHLALASTCQLLALGAALDVPVSLDIQPSTDESAHRVDHDVVPPLQQTRLYELSQQELDVLEQVAGKYDYSGVQVAHLVRVAQQAIHDEIAVIAEFTDAAATLAYRSVFNRRRWIALHRREFS